jgi:hypothetical protein
MKAFFITIFVIAALLGITYGLAYVGVIPVKKIAGKTPIVHQMLRMINLEQSPKKSVVIAAVPPPPPAPAPLPATVSTQIKSIPTTPTEIVTSSKVSAIYDTMKPASLALIFAKLPDSQVCDALLKMDEQKAGKVLVAMPPNRSAKLTILMNQATASSTSASGATP